MKIVRTTRARTDLLEILLHVAADSEAAATALVDMLDRRCELLRSFPSLGPLRGRRHKDVRQLTCGEYLVLYRVAAGRIEILR